MTATEERTWIAGSPTEPGAFWIKRKQDRTPRIAVAFQVGSERRYYFLETPNSSSVLHEDTFLWHWGPVELPPMPPK